MQAKLVALLVAVVIGFIAPQSAQAAPLVPITAPTTATVAAPVVTSSISIPHKKRKMTKASKHELSVAKKIRTKAQRGKKLDFSKAWKVTHNWTILNHYTYGLRLAGGYAVAGKADRAKLAQVNRTTNLMLAKASCHGKTDFKIGIGYYRIRMNSCYANAAEYAAVFTAASVAFLGAILPLSAPIKVVGAVAEFMYTVGALELAVCNRNNRGVRVYYTMATGMIPVYCRQQ